MMHHRRPGKRGTPSRTTLRIPSIVRTIRRHWIRIRRIIRISGRPFTSHHLLFKRQAYMRRQKWRRLATEAIGIIRIAIGIVLEIMLFLALS